MIVQVIHRKSLLQYGFMALPVAFAGFPLYVLAPDFYATHYGISLTLLGTLLLVIRLFDAIQDPFIGWLMDQQQGRLLPFIAIAGAVLCFSIFALFNEMLMPPMLWFILCMLFAISAYSFLTIILGSQATLWTIDEHEQTRIAGTRETFSLIGLIIAVLMPTLLSHLVRPKVIYLWYTVILAALMLIGIASFSRWMISTPPTPQRKQKLSLLKALHTLPQKSWQLFLVYAISMGASSIPAILVVFYVRDLLGAEHLIGLFFLLYFLSGAAAMPLCKKVSLLIGKYKAWALSNIIAITSFIGAFFLHPGDIWAYAFVCMLSGLALGADLILPPSILSDHIHQIDNSLYAGTHYAFLTFIAKITLALASAIALPLLDTAGFKPHVINSQTALMTLSMTYALIPCVLKLIATGLLYCFFIQSDLGVNNEHR